jgi:hypothetical protein
VQQDGEQALDGRRHPVGADPLAVRDLGVEAAGDPLPSVGAEIEHLDRQVRLAVARRRPVRGVAIDLVLHQPQERVVRGGRVRPRLFDRHASLELSVRGARESQRQGGRRQPDQDRAPRPPGAPTRGVHG